MELSDMLEITDILQKTGDTLESLWNQFELFCPKCLHFKMGQCIATLLEQEYMLETQCEVINSVFLLCQIAQPQNINPFNKVLFTFVNKTNPDTRVHAAAYLLSLLPFSHQILSSTTTQILNNVQVTKSPRKSFPYVPKPDCSLSIILDDPENDSKDSVHYKEVLSQLFNEDIMSRVFVPPLERPPPPLLIDPDEMVWLCPNDLEYAFEWDPTTEKAVKSIEIKTLFATAIKQALEPTQYSHFKAALAGNRDLIHTLGMSPSHLPKLIHNNPSLTVDILLILASTPQLFGDYLHVLINTELSLHSMEVVNKITANLELPPQFIHFYIRNCITSCTDISDKHTQHRYVRLVCVFLTALIRNHLVNVEEILVEIQAFCIDHSRIREATGLFRLLKSLDDKDE